MNRHTLAGKRVPPETVPDIGEIVAQFHRAKPDPEVADERVAFGTSGHRGSSSARSFNEDHIVAICQAILEHRRAAGIRGPVFLGMDTHALSRPAMDTALGVLVAGGARLVLDSGGDFTPTPVLSRAILRHNEAAAELADGVIITPSHNPPEDGGLKYNPPTGGPADAGTTAAIEARANEFLAAGLAGVERLSAEEARRAGGTIRQNLRAEYVAELGSILDMDAIAGAGMRIGVDPLGGASVGYWDAIAERYGIDIEVVNRAVDPSFSFMHLDWDGKIRMDCSSPDAMAGLVDLKDRFDIAFGLDPDADRHGIVTPPAGLMNPNHYLAVAVWYLFRNRPGWSEDVGVGKTLVSSSMIDRVAENLGRRLVEVPVGFKWFVTGLSSGEIGFGGEESAGASFLRRDQTPWTTDKDGILLCLLAAEITARTGRSPDELYRELQERFGAPVYERIDAPATAGQKAVLKDLAPDAVTAAALAGEPIVAKLTRAPGNDAPIGGLKVVTDSGWFAARPSGTEDVYKIYAESFRGPDHLRRIQDEARAIVDGAFESAGVVG